MAIASQIGITFIKIDHKFEEMQNYGVKYSKMPLENLPTNDSFI